MKQRGVAPAGDDPEVWRGSNRLRRAWSLALLLVPVTDGSPPLPPLLHSLGLLLLPSFDALLTRQLPFLRQPAASTDFAPGSYASTPPTATLPGNCSKGQGCEGPWQCPLLPSRGNYAAAVPLHFPNRITARSFPAGIKRRLSCPLLCFGALSIEPVATQRTDASCEGMRCPWPRGGSGLVHPAACRQGQVSSRNMPPTPLRAEGP